MRRFLAAGALLAGTLPIFSAGAQSPLPAAPDVQRWIAAAAIPLRSVELRDDLADLRPLASMIGRRRVVALGESTHGAHEPLAFRNRLFRFLVEQHGFTAIAIETGLPESQAVAEYVSGGRGAPPAGDAGRIASRGFTWGFGNFAENVELIRWMRDYNDDPRHPRKLRFYGVDLSLGGPQGSTPTPAAIESALRYLASVDSGAARRLRERFAPLMRHLPGDPSPSITPSERDRLTAAIDALVAQLAGERAAYAAASSADDHAWALRAAVVARQADHVHRVQPPMQPGGGVAPSAWRMLDARDSAMAENVRWALEREGSAGRVLVFAHDVHVKNAPTVGGPWTFERPPTVMGQRLRAALGEEMVIIGSVGGSKAGPARPSLDAALARGRVPLFVLDLRRGGAVAGVRGWLAAEHGLSVNGDATISLRPASAFDALLYIDSLTPARRNTP